ncbi:hypothetical protein AN642_00665 [Epulopiscium sp. SCG-B10WGA-EpuloA2]|nr:hypothetical protein AN642_00665 [Epulopiscium sp. SCG-B10WGA-EpuloA2]
MCIEAFPLVHVWQERVGSRNKKTINKSLKDDEMEREGTVWGGKGGTVGTCEITQIEKKKRNGENSERMR